MLSNVLFLLLFSSVLILLLLLLYFLDHSEGARAFLYLGLSVSLGLWLAAIAILYRIMHLIICYN